MTDKVLQWGVRFRYEGGSRTRAIVSGADGKSASRLVGMDECQPREDVIVNSKDWHPYKSELFHLFADVPGEEVDFPDRGGDRISIEVDGVTEIVTSTDKWRARHGGVELRQPQTCAVGCRERVIGQIHVPRSRREDGDCRACRLTVTVETLFA